MTQPSDEPAQLTVEIEGNRLALLPGGADRLKALLALIEGARQSLHLYYYIFSQDGCGRQVLDALIEARNRQVEVTLLIDAFGSANTPRSFFTPFIDAGGRFGVFGARRSTRYLIRNHQKMAIADGKRAIIGGFNCEDGYFSYPDDALGWCDLGLEVRGPLAGQLDQWFKRLAVWTLGQRQSFRQMRALVRRWHPGDAKASWVMGGPTRHLNGWAKRVKADLERGSRLDMVAAYFSPGIGMMRRIMRLARRGEARLILANKSDNSATIGAARHLYARMLRAGVAIFEFLPCKLHMKLVVVDDIAYVGSANFDKRSLFINLEVMLRVEDAAFAAQLRQLIARQANESRLIDRATYRRMTGPVSVVKWWFYYQLVGVLDYTVTRRLNFRREQRD